MRLDAACGCGATIQIQSGASDAWAEGRAQATFDNWTKIHAACPRLRPAVPPFPLIEYIEPAVAA
jgi:hypothetical protein